MGLLLSTMFIRDLVGKMKPPRRRAPCVAVPAAEFARAGQRVKRLRAVGAKLRTRS
jgi:hypothetical protein